MTVTSLRPRPGVAAAGLVGGAALTSGVALTATSGWLIARAAEHPPVLMLFTAIVAVRAFGMARPALRYAERVRSHDLALADLADRRTALYAALIPLTPGRLGRRARADVLSGVVDDLTEVVDSQVRVAVPVIASALAGGLTAVLTALVAPGVGLVLAGLLALTGLGCLVGWAVERRGQAAVLDARADVLRVSDLLTRQAADVAAVGGTRTVLGWLSTAQARLRRAVLAQSRGRALMSAVVLAGTGGATVLAAMLAFGADLSGPVKALLVLTPVALGDALNGLTDAVRAAARAQAARDRLDGLTAQSPAVAQVADPLRLPPVAADVPRLTISGLTAEWEPGRTALGPLDLTLEPGSRTAVVGANGGGKSTLLAVLARWLDPVRGTYAVDGVDAREVSVEDVRALVAVVDDEPHIFATSLRENVRLATDGGGDATIEEAVRLAGLGPWLDALPDGLDTRLGSGDLGVSGGERARLGLARALASGRPVILLDEPLAHLDHATAETVLADVIRATRGRTVVMVSHRPEGLDAFDTVLDLAPSAS